MKIFEVVNKPLTDPSIFTEEGLVTYIKENCQPWLQQTNNGKLKVYRGTKRGNGKDPFIHPIRDDRVPSTSSKEYTEFFNYLIDIVDPQNLAPRRHNAAFVNSREEVADAYGKSYVFIPIGNFSFVWSPILFDWYDMEDCGNVEFILKSDVIAKLLYKDNTGTELERFAHGHCPLPKWVNKNKVKKNILTKNLPAAIESGHEIMIKAKAGLYIPPSLYEKIQPKLETNNINEGKYDPHTKKAVFLLGGPGSGKTSLSKKLFGHTGLRPVNVDDFYEMIMDKTGIVGGYQDDIYKQAHKKYEKRLNLLLDNDLGIVLDGTGKNPDRIRAMYQQLKKRGYDVMAVFINTPLDVALERNELRQRKVDPEILKRMHKQVRNNLGVLQAIFKNNMVIVDNEAIPDLSFAHKQIDNFLK